MAEVPRLADAIGPDRLTTTEAARAIGIGQPAILRHVSTRDALWLAVVEDIAARLQLAPLAAGEGVFDAGARQAPAHRGAALRSPSVV